MSEGLEIPAISSAVTLGSSSGGRTSGKAWKLQKSATKRSHLQRGVKAKSWDDRMEKTTRDAAVNKMVKQLKEEKEAERVAKIEKIKNRRKAKEEKERLEQMRAKMSQKKIDRLRRKAGRSKKVNG